MIKTLGMIGSKLLYFVLLLSNLITWPIQMTICVHYWSKGMKWKDWWAAMKRLNKEDMNLLFLIWDPDEYFDRFGW